MKANVLLGLSLTCVIAHAAPLPQADGYRGLWYSNQPSKDEYKFKYSGGLATYPQQHAPLAVYCAAVDKTFFCYGGTTTGDKRQLLHMVSFFDHKTGTVPRPTILLNKLTEDAHDNPILSVDAAGHIWIISPSHGTGRPSFIHRSLKPYAIDEFEQVLKTNFSYPSMWFLRGQGFMFFQTRYASGSMGSDAIRRMYWQTSADGRTWAEPQPLAKIEMGDYQISWPCGQRVATAFDFHPKPIGLNGRANIYYVETADAGKSWHTAAGATVTPPFTNAANPALVFDSRAEKQLVYLKDLNFDTAGRPVILFLTSKGYAAGPTNGPRQWQTLRWNGQAWERRPLTTSGNNYDHGSLFIEPDGAWRVIAPTELGPQPYNPGGEMVMWLSRDQGGTWTKTKQLTRDSSFNHTYARRPLNAHPDFYAFWADGHARQPSESRLYFTNKTGDHVWRLPTTMTGDAAKPEIAW